jgi:hypothetical protein
MARCKTNCLHRAIVREYRDARDAYEATVENVALGYATEMEEYRRENPGITFKQWLIGKAAPRQA